MVKFRLKQTKIFAFSLDNFGNLCTHPPSPLTHSLVFRVHWMPTLTANWINIKNNHDGSLAFDWDEARYERGRRRRREKAINSSSLPSRLKVIQQAERWKFYWMIVMQCVPNSFNHVIKMNINRRNFLKRAVRGIHESIREITDRSSSSD